jgi:hypothetical protein
MVLHCYVKLTNHERGSTKASDVINKTIDDFVQQHLGIFPVSSFSANSLESKLF